MVEKTVKDKILSFLETHQSGTASELISVSGASPPTARVSISQLKNDGQIMMVERGVYAFPISQRVVRTELPEVRQEDFFAHGHKFIKIMKDLKELKKEVGGKQQLKEMVELLE